MEINHFLRYNWLMQISQEFKNRFGKKEKSRFLHSPNHVLADELSRKFAEPKRFGFYLKMAQAHDHNFLRKIAGEVLESKAKKPGALFAYLVKKESVRK